MITLLGLVAALSFAPAPNFEPSSAPAGERKSTKLATLVPKGSSYHKALLAMGEAWKSGPDGGAGVTIYPEGTWAARPTWCGACALVSCRPR